MGASVSAADPNTKAPPGSNIVITRSPTTPDYSNGTFVADPNYGFDEQGKQRKERVPTMTKAELSSANVEHRFRDYCAHKYVAFKKCNKEHVPWPWPCRSERHELEECQYEEYLIRMKEYERERRLLHRKQRKEKAEARANKAI